MNLFVPLHPGASLPLPATDRFPEAGHLWGQAEIDALTLACAARRPLLVRGEAGSGKSQIARAAAQVLADRKVAISHGYPPVGLAEYIDLLAALHELTATCTEAEEAQKAQLDWLQRLSVYVLVKNADQDQTRPPLSLSQSLPDLPAVLAADVDRASE